jgi:WD40 repeat protein
MLSFPDMRKQRSLKGHTASVMSVALDRQQRYIATGGGDAVACLWDMEDFICQRTYIGMDYPIRCLRLVGGSWWMQQCLAGGDCVQEAAFWSSISCHSPVALLGLACVASCAADP